MSQIRKYDIYGCDEITWQLSAIEELENNNINLKGHPTLVRKKSESGGVGIPWCVFLACEPGTGCFLCI